MSKSKGCCVLMLSPHEAAALQANLLAALMRTDKGAFEQSMGVDIRKIASCIGPGGIYDCDGGRTEVSEQAAEIVSALLGEPTAKDEGHRKAPADPQDVVKDALEKAAGGKVIPVDFVPKNKE